jgi:hypothetical protein
LRGVVGWCILPEVGFPTPAERGIVAEVRREYEVKADSKRRVTLRSSEYTYYHAWEFEDGRILLEPRELRAPATLSHTTLGHMDEAIRRMNAGEVGDEFDLSEVEDLLNEA